ncbi:MAG: VWA domain-containing protein [Thermoanaerobaculia bacterium]
MIPSGRECPQTVGLLLTLATSLIASTPAAAQQPRDQTPFGEQINVRVVTLPVVARDGRGRPVTDLQAGEITVREGKKTYRVDSLTRYITQAGSRPDLPRVRLITNLDSERQQVAATRTAEPRSMVIVVDVENDPLVERQRATDALKRFLETELDPSFQVALLLFDGQVRQLVPFTQDRRAVIAALDNVHTERKSRARLAPGTAMQQLLGNKLPMCVDMPDLPQCLRDTGNEYVGEITMKASTFVDALDSIVGYVEGLEGHKSVLVVGGSVSLNPASEAAEAMRALYGHMNEITEWEQSARSEEVVRPRLDAVFARAFRNRVSISFVDRTPAPSDVSARFGEQLQPGFRPMSAAFHAAQQDLNEIAAATGGSFVASTRVDEGLRQAMALMQGAYDLTIYLPDNEPLTPRRLRRISIDAARRGVKISHRRGFEGARADEEPSTPLGGTVQTGAFVQQELDGTSVAVIPLRFILDPADLGYEEKGDVAAAQFTVHLRLRTAEGELLTDLYRVLSHTYPLELWRKQDIEPPALLAFADVPPGDYIAEAVVTVPRLGQRGTLRRQFTAAAAVAEAPVSEEVAEPTITAADALPPAEQVPVQRRTVSGPRGTSTPPDRESRPSIAFARHFLGVVNGDVDVSVLVGQDVSSVELLLDGERVGITDKDPWTVPMSLGEALSPRELVAVARDPAGREVGRVRQWLNLPRPWTELEVVLSDGGGGALTGRVALESVGGERPRQVTVSLDGSPVWVSNSPTFLLPAVDMNDIHILRVEAEFEKAGVVSRDVVFGGRYVQQVSAELTSVALQIPRSGEPRLEDVQIHAGGRPVSVVALEKGPADVIVVIDPDAIRTLPGITIAGSADSAKATLARGLDGMLTPAETDVHLRLLWPVSLRVGAAGQVGYRLFPSTDPDAPSAGGFLAHVAGAAFPSGEGRVLLADAVAVAGPMAVERGRRRVVLLVHGGSSTGGKYSASAVRAYLEQLRVPLVVWSTGKPTRAVLDDWGAMEIVSTRMGLRNAWVNLIRKLDRQRVAWIEGMVLPQTLETVGRELELAGVRR